MTITELIAKLESVRAEHGDLPAITQEPYEDTTCFIPVTEPVQKLLFRHEDGGYRPWPDFGREDDGKGHQPVKVVTF